MNVSFYLYHFQKSIDNLLKIENLPFSEIEKKVNDLFAYFLQSTEDLDNKSELDIEAEEYKNEALKDLVEIFKERGVKQKIETNFLKSKA